MSDPLARTKIGLVSDTHGELPDQVLDIFAGCDLIVHAGDVGSAEILFALQAVAPVVAVAGNTDRPKPSWPLDPIRRIEIAGARLIVVHDRNHLGLVPPDTDVVIWGHTHEPQVLEFGGVQYVNPGSASRSRTTDGVGTVGLLVISLGRIRPRIISL